MIDRKVFFAQYKKQILHGRALTTELVAAIDRFLDFMESDILITSLYQRSYLLATTEHETAHTFLPIKELGGRQYFITHYWNNVNVRNQLGNKTQEDAWNRSGAGFAQCTGLANDIKLTNALPKAFPQLIQEFETRTGKKFNLIENHWQLLDPEIAYAAISYGMYTGLFTGRKISDYVTDLKNDFLEYKQARRVINGQDRAVQIANLALQFEAILLLSSQ